MRIKLKLLRTKQRLSQEEMAHKVGFTRATYQAIECGARKGSQRFWECFQRAFDIADDEMWSFQKDEK